MPAGSGSNLFIHIVSYGRGGIFVNFMKPSMLRKMTITSAFPHQSHYDIRQSVCLFISFRRQIKVYVYSPKNSDRHIIPKTVLKVKYVKNTKSPVCC